ncbi:MAG: BrnT family toxin [bacterium]
MLFIWDTHKANSNLQKHNVSFELAQTVFDDPLHLSILDEKNRGEKRWITVGQCATTNVLIVVHTYHVDCGSHETIRIISARLATKKEKRQYEKGI